MSVKDQGNIDYIKILSDIKPYIYILTPCYGGNCSVQYMTSLIKTIQVLNNMNIQNKDQHSENKMDEKVLNPKKIGRNEPCPCGSKKKYKHCHGKVSLG